jgi:hypothetical protein
MCAKPQREEDIPASEPVIDTTAVPPPPAPVVLPVTFHNRIAVQIAMMTASFAALLCWVFVFGFVIWLPGAGFTAVHLYRRRTGQSLSPGAGARMGWITGTFLFGITALLFTISFVAVVNSEGGLAAVYQQQVHNMPMADPNATAQAIKMMQNPVTAGGVIVVFLMFLFTVIMSFCAAGGALGAKLMKE